MTDPSDRIIAHVGHVDPSDSSSPMRAALTPEVREYIERLCKQLDYLQEQLNVAEAAGFVRSASSGEELDLIPAERDGT